MHFVLPLPRTKFAWAWFKVKEECGRRPKNAPLSQLASFPSPFGGQATKGGRKACRLVATFPLLFISTNCLPFASQTVDKQKTETARPANALRCA
jgi:hypothetical protein